MRHRYFVKISRKNVWQLLVMYACALFYTVFLTPNRYRGREIEINLVPILTNIQRFYEQGNEYFWPYYIGYWGNIFGNIVLFAPFGFLVSLLYPEKPFRTIVLYGLLVSTGIETLQLILRIGVCDIDDVILNVTGVVTGIGAFRIIKKKYPEWFAQKP